MSAALAGIIGPLLFGTVLLALSVLEYDFMLGIGWRPLSGPTGAWPSERACPRSLRPRAGSQLRRLGSTASLLRARSSSRGDGRGSVLRSSLWQGQLWPS